MKIPKQARRDAKALFRNCCVNGLLDENRVRTALQRVIQARPRGYVAMLQHLRRLVKLDLDRRSARVENAVESSNELMNTIRTALAKRYGPGLNIAFSIDPELIAGVRVKVGSDVYDGSVKTRLEALQAGL
jgi:F-type H+-transporting ATPase subunit delta